MDGIPLKNLAGIDEHLVSLNVAFLIGDDLLLNWVHRQPMSSEHNNTITAGLKSLFHIFDEHRVHHLAIDFRRHDNDTLITSII